MSIKAFLKALLRRVNVTGDPTTYDSYYFSEVTDATNAAFQIMWTDIPRANRLHYSRSTISVSLLDGTNKYTLPDNVQSVLANPFMASDNVPLQPVTYLSDIHGFDALTASSKTTLSRPIVYYDEAEGIDDAAEATQINLWVAPTPDTDETLTVRVELEAPRIEVDAFCADPSPVLPIPHKYVESTLLPIAAYQLALSTNRIKLLDVQMIPKLQEAANNALRRAGVTIPTVAAAANSTRPSDS
jgi:hypothetical protein